LERAGGELEYLKLLKLMYLAERESLFSLSNSITGDIFVSMKHGPVMSTTYDLIKQNWDDLDHETWEASFAKQGYRLRLWKKPPIEEILSPFEIELANQVWLQFGTANQWELVEWIHGTFPEWQAMTSAIPIERESIYRAMGLADDEIQSRLGLQRAVSEFDALLALAQASE
jgi:uncharacterized phage-associated protein